MKLNEIYAISGFLSALILWIWSILLFFKGKKFKLGAKVRRDLAIFVCLLSVKEYLIPNFSSYNWAEFDFNIMSVITTSYLVTLYFLVTIVLYDFSTKGKEGKINSKILFFYVAMFVLVLVLTIFSTRYLIVEGRFTIDDFW